MQSALTEHKLLLIRGQEVNESGHRTVAGLFGLPIVEFAGNRSRVLTNRDPGGAQAYSFHRDFSFTEGGPVAAISLCALEVPFKGTSTVFSDAVLALETLPDVVRERISTLEAWDTLVLGEQKPVRRNPVGKVESRFRTLHPVIGIHPRSGAGLISVSDIHTERIAGVSRADSLRLIDLLCEHIAKPEHCYEHRWELNDLIIWDNVALHHARSESDITEGARSLRRLVLDSRRSGELSPLG
jgi:taurine dioxygenase